MKPSLLLFFALMIASGCNNAAHEQTPKEKSDSIMRAFNEINNSIIKSNKSVQDKNDSLYSVLAGSPGKKMLADSLNIAYHTTLTFIEDTKKKLELAGSTNDGIDGVNKIMVAGKQGIKLYSVLNNYSKFVTSCCMDSNKIKEEQMIFSSVNSPHTAQHFLKTYFSNIPQMAAITMLNKFTNDCKNAQLIVLQDLRTQK